MDLQESVNRSLNHSRDNGYNPESETAHQLAIDLATCDPDLEDVSIEEIQSAVENWLKLSSVASND